MEADINSTGKIHGNGVKNLKGAMPFPCILIIKLPSQNGREPFKIIQEYS